MTSNGIGALLASFALQNLLVVWLHVCALTNKTAGGACPCKVRGIAVRSMWCCVLWLQLHCCKAATLQLLLPAWTAAVCCLVRNAWKGQQARMTFVSVVHWPPKPCAHLLRALLMWKCEWLAGHAMGWWCCNAAMKHGGRAHGYSFVGACGPAAVRSAADALSRCCCCCARSRYVL